MASIKSKSLLEILINRSEQIVIPIYQRNYDWKPENVTRLLDDLLEFARTTQDDEETLYFLGNMVFKRTGSNNDSLQKMILVDGQQRITTTLLILSYLKNEQKVDVNSYLTVDEDGEQKLKISKMNNSSALSKIIKNKPLNKDEQLTNYWKNYLAIKNWFEENEVSGVTIRNILDKKTAVAWVQLKKEENENKVFETINSTGEPLKSSDLIKNRLFFGALEFTHEQEEELIQIYVENIEKKFEDIEEMDEFFRFYVAVKGQYELPNKGSRQIYKLFEKYLDDQKIDLSNFDSTKNLVLDILKSSLIFVESNKNIEKIQTPEDSRNYFFKEIFNHNKGTYFGMLYSMVDYWYDLSYQEQDSVYKSELIEKNEAPSLNEIYKVIAKYITFRAISGKKDKNITRDAVKFFKLYQDESAKNNTGISIDGFFSFMQERESDEQKVPKESELIDNIKNLDAYKISVKKTRNILLACELGSNSSQPFNQFDVNWQVEHIMPQDWATYWAKDLGKDENDVPIVSKYVKGVHSLPNLTLLTDKLNPEVSNREWVIKKQKIIADSRLQIDKMMVNYEIYNEKFLTDRAQLICDNVINLFK